MAFIVTEQPFGASIRKPSLNELALWSKLGPDELPETTKERALGPNARCEALVYEFYRATQDDIPKQISDSRILAVDHLAVAGFWTRQELGP